jgi:uncharacterized protein YpiB (UPF0302 family)
MNKAQKAEAMKLADYINAVEDLLQQIYFIDAVAHIKKDAATLQAIINIKAALHNLGV